jgi:hypothetical protein
MKSLLLHDEFVVQHRFPKPLLDPRRAYAATWEEELDDHGALASTAVIFLTNKECPFRCVMCDLWVNTLDATVPRGAIAAQIRTALADRPAAGQIKLYNAGSFFDPSAIPQDDDAEIAEVVRGFGRVIVEAHPAFLAGVYGERCLRFRDAISVQLEVAIGLETAHPDVLARLNKKMTLESFRRATHFLREHDIALRVFILLSPPFMPRGEEVEWAHRSLDVAAECGASVSVGTRLNSCWLSVATALPATRAVAAIWRSCAPTSVPAAASAAHTRACTRASASPNGITGMFASTPSTNSPRARRTPASRARSTPCRSSDAEIAASATGSSPSAAR